MALADGDVVEYAQLLKSDVEVFLLKFEQFIKEQNRNGKSSS